MKGYFTAEGYYGWLDGEYTLFASESDYVESYNMLNEKKGE